MAALSKILFLNSCEQTLKYFYFRVNANKLKNCVLSSSAFQKNIICVLVNKYEVIKYLQWEYFPFDIITYFLTIDCRHNFFLRYKI